MAGLQREAALRDFGAGRCDCAVCMVESCGVAIDLSRACVCIFLELPDTARAAPKAQQLRCNAVFGILGWAKTV
eukprot:15255148-Alexandrium_andersonii.AAC.1